MLRSFLSRVSTTLPPANRWGNLQASLLSRPPSFYYATAFAKPNLACHSSRFFSSLPLRNIPPITPYVLGPLVTQAYVQKNQLAIQSSKQELKALLNCSNPLLKDVSTFVDLLFDLEKSSTLIKKIDAAAHRILSEKSPWLFQQYEKAALDNNPHTLNLFLKTDFLPALRAVFQELAKHYGFDPALVETNDGVLLDDDYMDFISQGKLVLDLGEDGHGPFPHLIAAFMMKELELAGQLSSACSLYQSLAERSPHYCPDRANFNYRFRLLLDFPNSYSLKSTQLCNPSSLANHLLFNCDTLKQFASVCKNHSQALAKLSLAEWEQMENKTHLVSGKVIRF